MHVWLIACNDSVEKAFIGPQEKAEELKNTLSSADYASVIRTEGWLDYSDYCNRRYWAVRMVEAYSG